MRRDWPRALVLAAVVVVLLVAFRTGDARHFLLALVESVRDAGWPGALLFAAIYVVAAVVMLPALILTLSAGFAWGPIVGFIIVVPAATLGATTAFLLGRTVARDFVQRRFSNSPRLRATDEAVGSGGFRVVVLLRLSPLVPYNLLNYALGLSGVSLRDFVVGSAIGMAPGCLMYLYVGSLVTDAGQLLSGERPSAGPVDTAFQVAGLLATVVVTAWLTRRARTALSKTLAEPQDPPP